jgi:peptide/nickel transport system substrate-binding protein
VQATCQVLPPNFPGYRPYCPYTADPSPTGRWVAPDLERARKLISASGTEGQRIKAWATDPEEGAYVATLLRRLGYRTRLTTIRSLDDYFAAIFDPKNKVQIAALRWFADFPAASGFINSSIFDCTNFCDKAIDRLIAKAPALQTTDEPAANRLWARIDRELTDQAPWLFLYNTKQSDFVSSRVGNFQYKPAVRHPARPALGQVRQRSNDFGPGRRFIVVPASGISLGKMDARRECAQSVPASPRFISSRQPPSTEARRLRKN